jgi:Glycosyl transferase family 2
MKLAAASRIVNESDRVGAFVRHTAHFVDHHFFVDNGSVDGTLGILQKLKDESFAITVFQSNARSRCHPTTLTSYTGVKDPVGRANSATASQTSRHWRRFQT